MLSFFFQISFTFNFNISRRPRHHKVVAAHHPLIDSNCCIDFVKSKAIAEQVSEV